jgi:hypothetical protein
MIQSNRFIWTARCTSNSILSHTQLVNRNIILFIFMIYAQVHYIRGTIDIAIADITLNLHKIIQQHSSSQEPCTLVHQAEFNHRAVYTEFAHQTAALVFLCTKQSSTQNSLGACQVQTTKPFKS